MFNLIPVKMKTQTIQITIGYLEEIIRDAKKMQKYDNSLSNTIVIATNKPTNNHVGSDEITAWLKSNYSECNGKMII